MNFSSFSRPLKGLLERPELFRYPSPIDGTSVRLLQIKPLGLYNFLTLGRLELTMETFPLDNLPEFRALSYTWGPPEVGMPQYTDNDKRGILINGRHFKVYPNLFYALIELQKSANNPQLPIWIDAICINQDDVTERANQVAIMDRIYKKASYTYVWLGLSRSYFETLVVTYFFMHIMRIPQEEWADLLKSPPPDPYRMAEILDRYILPRAEWFWLWAPLLHFFQRSWFSRVWIIQEIALSRRIVVLLGRERVDWEVLERLAFFISIIRLSRDLLYKDGSIDDQELLSDPFDDFRLISQLRGLSYADSSGVDRREHQRVLCEGVWNTTNDSDIRPASLLMHLALVLRSRKATDQRDKVYGLLGIVNHMLGEWKTSHINRADIPVDYADSNTPALLFEQIATQVILQTQSLSVITSQIDAPDDRLRDIASWCPDLSVPTAVVPLMVILPSFNASRQKTGRSEGNRFNPEHMIVINNRRIHAKAVHLSQIATLGVGAVQFTGATGVPDLSWMQLLLSQSVQYTFTGENRVEAFWRTLLINAVGRKTPAQWTEFKNGEPFQTFVSSLVRLQYEAVEEQGIQWKEFLRGMTAIDELATSDPAGHMPSTADLEREDPNEMSDAFKRSYMSKLSAFGRSLDSWFQGNKFVVSEQGHFALVPEWSGKGDSIVVVSGCPCPLVVRPHSVDPSCWIMVGVAYVHGMMYGEAIDDNSEWEDICIG